MDYFLSTYLEANFPYVSLMVGVVASLMLYVAILYQVQRLRCAVVLYRQRVEGLEGQLAVYMGKRAAAEPEEETPGAERGPRDSRATQHKVLELHSLGRSNGEIAREAGIREAEVEFVLKVSDHVAASGGELALRKIS